MKYAAAGDLIVLAGKGYRPDGPGWTQSRDGAAWWRIVHQSGPVADDVFVLQQPSAVRAGTGSPWPTCAECSSPLTRETTQVVADASMMLQHVPTGWSCPNGHAV